MQHAEAHERLSDLALEPARLARLDLDSSAVAGALRDHIATCPECRVELASWRRTWVEAGPAFTRRERLDLLRPPAALRGRVLAAAHADAVAGGLARARRGPPLSAAAPQGEVPAADAITSGDVGRPNPPRAIRLRRLATSGRLPWLVAAAGMVVAVLGTSLGLGRTAELDALRADTAELAGIAASFQSILATPRHWTVALKTADGTAHGTLAWSGREIVVVATGLPAPGSGQAYRCWVEADGMRTPMGTMSFNQSIGYWAASMDAWAGASWANAVVPGVRFGVSLVPADGQGTPVLIGTL